MGIDGFICVLNILCMKVTNFEANERYRLSILCAFPLPDHGSPGRT